MPTILLQNHQFNYTLIPKSIRSIRLRLLTRRSFVVSCPRHTTPPTIDHFLRQHALWIVKHSQKLNTKKNILQLSRFTILEQDYQLTFCPTIRDSVLINQSDHHITINFSRPSSVTGLIDKKFRPFALKLIKSELQQLARKFNFSYNRVSIRNQKSRLGSCSHSGNLSFNWQIIFFPEDKFRHILLHELTHLAIPNHSSKFWSQLTVYDPDCLANRRWVRTEGSKHFIVI